MLSLCVRNSNKLRHSESRKGRTLIQVYPVTIISNLSDPYFSIFKWISLIKSTGLYFLSLVHTTVNQSLKYKISLIQWAEIQIEMWCFPCLMMCSSIIHSIMLCGSDKSPLISYPEIPSAPFIFMPFNSTVISLNISLVNLSSFSQEFFLDWLVCYVPLGTHSFSNQQ